MTLYFTEEDQAKYEKTLREIHFESQFGFLNAHNGLRRGCLHVLLGTSGGGKSTLARSILRDLICNNSDKIQVAVWLSEETVEEYKMQLATGMPSMTRLLRTEAESELDIKDSFGEMRLFEWLEFNRPDVLLFDNITTSKFYMDKRPGEQGEFVKKVKSISKKLNMATIMVAHTDSKVSDSQKDLITLNQIRGGKDICNLTEFAYILQRFETSKGGFYPTLRVVKHRSQNLIHNSYHLKYEPRVRSYIGDASINFEEMNAAFKSRNRLGG